MSEFILDDSVSQSLKDFASAFEPYGKKTPEGSELRKRGFSDADSNGTGQISLAEMGGFIQSVLKNKFSDGEDDRLFRLYRPCYIYAFNNAKSLKKSGGKKLNGTKNATADDYISFPEFRMFTVYLRIYAAMFDIFSTVDGGSEGRTEDDDKRLNLDEFLASYENFKGYGFKGLRGLTSEGKAVELFDKIDANDGGLILFSEWSKYIKKEEIAAKTHIGTLLSGNLKPRQLSTSDNRNGSRSGRKPVASKYSSRRTATSGSVSSSSVRSKSRTSNANSNKKFQMIMPVKVAGAYKPRKGASSDLKKFIKSFQPYAEKQRTSLALRKTGFASCDNNRSGQCSLAEVDSFVNQVLKADYGPIKGTELFKTFRPAYIVAYNGAKNLKKNATGNDADYINFAEFRILNAYLCIYTGMLDSFQLVDGGGAGVDGDDDRRVEKAEWINGYAEFRNSGFVALSTVTDEKSALSAFKVMDTDGGGVVRFSEFCDWIGNAEISHSTSLGKLLKGSALQKKSTNDDVSLPQDRLISEPLPLASTKTIELLPEPEPEPEPEAPDTVEGPEVYEAPAAEEESEEPSEPVLEEYFEVPVELEEPEEPETPDETDLPEERNESEAPEEIDEPEEPEAPEIPEETDEPEDPEEFEAPEEIDEPEEPDEPETPEETDEPEEPEEFEASEEIAEHEEPEDSEAPEETDEPEGREENGESEEQEDTKVQLNGEAVEEMDVEADEKKLEVE